MPDYLVQEEDASRFALEDATGFLILEEEIALPGVVVGMDRTRYAVSGGMLPGAGVVGTDHATAQVVDG